MTNHIFVALGLLVGNALFTPVAKDLSGRIAVGVLAAILYLIAMGLLNYFRGQ